MLNILASAAALLAALLVASPAYARRELQSLVTLAAQGPGQVISADQSSAGNEARLKCVVNLSAYANGPTVIVAVQGHDLSSDTYYNIAATPGLRGQGQSVISLGDTAASALPLFWRVVATVIGPSNATATGTVGCSTL